MQPASSPAARYHQYLTGLVDRLFVTTDAPSSSVMFAGVDRGRDVALLAAAAAEVLASRVAGRICLVDADVDAPSLHQYYGARNEPGLIDAITHDGTIGRHAHLIAQASDSSLWLMPAGTIDASVRATEPLSPVVASPSSASRIRDLISAFDFVVIAAPPVSRLGSASVMAASVMSSVVDGVVLVADANVSTRTTVREAVDALRGAGAHVLGTVLNNREFPIPDVLYRFL